MSGKNVRLRPPGKLCRMTLPQPKSFEDLVSAKVENNEGSNIEAFHSNIFIFPFLRKDIAWFMSITSMPTILKVHLLVRMVSWEMGVEVITVLNCGSYQLDYVLATIDVLEEVIVLCSN
ncbi:aldolase-type TIM barrel family protein [Artemisia annua]|uniref:Aldolase-type TIM barrel family protein n=1 Tax=Artemisia annua TaxID=35608 RepID=A0A2U1NN26_ARTAN|nr:aldolase-type TIM barrel family protein [Artemisia annua]